LGKEIAELVDDAFSQSLDRLFDPKTGRYYAPYNQTVEEEDEKVHTRGYTGEGTIIAVLDTGVLSHHPGLKGRLVGSADFTGEGPEDYNGHGTAVALLAAGPLRPGPSILNVKVLGRNGRGAEDNIVAGMRWAANNGANALNMSLCIYRDCDGTCALCQEATRILKEQEVLIYAAAGNEGPGVPACPAQCCPAVIAVGASDYTGTHIADYSGRGDSYPPGEYLPVPVDEDGTWRVDLFREG
jgi:subtilisin family serine protease